MRNWLFYELFRQVYQRSKRQLAKLDKNTAKLIASWLKNNLEGCENPRVHGKALVAKKSGQWRHRIGDYRTLAEINDAEIIILILQIGHRSKICREYATRWKRPLGKHNP